MGDAGKCESADKPGSVVDSHSSGAAVASGLVRPTREPCGPQDSSPIWSCSGWGLQYHLNYSRRGALLPHHFTLTSANAGGIFSVALAVGSRPPGVTWHPALWSPDFPPRRNEATAWPTHRRNSDRSLIFFQSLQHAVTLFFMQSCMTRNKTGQATVR